MAGLHGHHFIAGAAEAGAGEAFAGVDPSTGADLAPGYVEATLEQVDRACAAASAAAPAFAATAPEVRAALLRDIGQGLVDLGDELVDRVQAETALPSARVQGERARTVMQLNQFADLVEEGSWVDARIDHAIPDRAPMPKPDLRRMLVPLGPVAVFGASNFPLAYSVAGGDTAPALAAGCPVVVKGHPAHPGTSELVGGVVHAAVEKHGLPPGTFSLLHGRGHALGAALVQHAAVKAVGFTGSHAGGRALFNLAGQRPEPIPVFAEMGSANPVVVLPNAMRARGGQIAEQLAASSLLAQGQFCTSPGIVLWVDGDGAEGFADALRQRMTTAQPGPVVHPSIRGGFERALGELAELPVQVDQASAAPHGASDVCAAMLQAAPADVVRHERLRSEVYGPAVLAVGCSSAEELQQVLETLEGHLTGTIHGDGDDFERHAPAVAALQRKVGRLIANGVPTGVEVSSAMVHGGPYPAATDARFSAVGSTAILRWVRPACWQDWPHDQLPPELRDDNPRGVQQLVNGARA
jgi:alpha-ketoglutaric semialdehyde dehydrogenase